MKYGIGIHAEFPPERFGALCRSAEAIGFERIWVPDERFQRDLAVALTLAAARTRSIGIGTAVTDPFIRHPALTASLMASVDEVSGGRLVVGLGAGVSGFGALGVRREHPQTAMREAVTLMRSLWRAETVDFTGKTTAMKGGHLDYAPVRADIPIWIGGRGPAVLALAGEIADGVLYGSLASVGGAAYAESHVARGRAVAGRAADAIVRGIWLHTALHDDERAARDAGRPIVTGALISSRQVLDKLGVTLSDELARSLEGVTYGIRNPRMLEVARGLPDDIVDSFSVAGSPSTVRARFADLSRRGFDHVAIVPWLAPGQTLESFLARVGDVLVA